MSLSTTEAEYIAAGLACAQVLWMRHTLKYYGINLGTSPIMVDNQSAICLSKNPVQHSRTKHIDVRHHFLDDHVTRKDIILEYVESSKQLADIFTKPLKEETFVRLRGDLGIMGESEI